MISSPTLPVLRAEQLGHRSPLLFPQRVSFRMCVLSEDQQPEASVFRSPVDPHTLAHTDVRTLHTRMPRHEEDTVVTRGSFELCLVQKRLFH